MISSTITIMSLRPAIDGPLEFDLKHILHALRPFLSEWVWCIQKVDWLGDDISEDVCQKVAGTGANGLWISSDALLEIVNKVYQTIEGVFLAFPIATDPGTLPLKDIELKYFPTSPASLAIVAIDGSFFEVYTKDAKHIGALQIFEGIQYENPNLYF
jgi:hypothetical protein